MFTGRASFLNVDHVEYKFFVVIFLDFRTRVDSVHFSPRHYRDKSYSYLNVLGTYYFTKEFCIIVFLTEVLGVDFYRIEFLSLGNSCSHFYLNAHSVLFHVDDLFFSTRRSPFFFWLIVDSIIDFSVFFSTFSGSNCV